MTDYTAKDYARLAHWQTQKPHAQQNPELIDALLYAKELASARGTTEACEARRQAARGGGTVVEKTRETSPIDYTEREVRERIESLEVGAWPPRNDLSIAMLTQLADMLAEREKAEPIGWVFQHEETGQMTFCENDGINNAENFAANNPRHVLCGPAYTHPAAQVPDEYGCEAFQNEEPVAGATSHDPAEVLREADHYAAMYGQDGPVEVTFYSRRELTRDAMLAAQEDRSRE